MDVVFLQSLAEIINPTDILGIYQRSAPEVYGECGNDDCRATTSRQLPVADQKAGRNPSIWSWLMYAMGGI